MNPEYLPINLTRPTPLTLEVASVYATYIIFAAIPKEVPKPNEWSMIGISLSIVFGIPIKDMGVLFILAYF